MAQNSENNPLPPCPVTPNCIRTSRVYKAKANEVMEALRNIFEKEAHSFDLIDSDRYELHAVYRIPVFGFKDDVDVILEYKKNDTTVFIRSASRLGAYDLGVNKRRVKRIFKKLKLKI